MTRIYCKRNDLNMLDFYLSDGSTEYYLFSQKAYTGVENFFKRGVPFNKAIRHKNGKADFMIHKTMSKLPVYIRYVEKEYGIAFFEQSKKQAAA